MIVLVIACVVFMIVDARSGSLKQVRSLLLNFAVPFYWIADVPNKLVRLNRDWFTSREELSKRNVALETKVLILQGRLQKMAQINIENARLRNLLKSSLILQDNILVAEVIGVSPSHFNHFMIINKGREDNVFIGQSVLSAEGLLGQVVEVNRNSSRVLLITDSSHAVPVQVNRSGVRGIVEGKSEEQELDLVQVPVTADVQVGDLLISSGLAGHFPGGYPVAKVMSVDKVQNQFFSLIKAKPLANVNSSRFVLLVFSKHQNNFDDLLDN